MPTRPFKFCLALQEDSVFTDFDMNHNGCLYLVRISFDGYGCCHPESEVGKIDNETSKRLIKIIENDKFSTSEASKILSKYFKENKAKLWEYALVDHDII
ncbi:MAG: hypothetical protein AB8B80_08945 [Marinicellaceae bacterium]